MATIFTKIIKGEIPSYKIAENDEYFAFLDIRPLAKGHTLVVPKEEIDYLFDLSESQLAGIMAFSKKVAKAIEAAVQCKRVGVLVVGTEVPHAHIHLVPFQRESQMNITSSPVKIGEEEMEAVAASIRKHL